MVDDHGKNCLLRGSPPPWRKSQISKFKATCHAVLERVRKTRRAIRVTRLGEPVAEVVPPSAEPKKYRLLNLVGNALIRFLRWTLRRRESTGAGLGLTTISARLVEMMGGTVRLESELGRGSEFSFTACLGGVDSKEAKVGTAFSLRDTRDVGAVLRVLLAEDNQVNHRLAARLLEKRGHRVSLAANGLEALENEGYDLVLMDLRPPR
jgi:CheY-like chemotaxis protein